MQKRRKEIVYVKVDLRIFGSPHQVILIITKVNRVTIPRF